MARFLNLKERDVKTLLRRSMLAEILLIDGIALRRRDTLAPIAVQVDDSNRMSGRKMAQRK